jgi:hypothetical protein
MKTEVEKGYTKQAHTTQKKLIGTPSVIEDTSSELLTESSAVLNGGTQ